MKIKIITKKEVPGLFKHIHDVIIEESYSEHRRGSNFFTKSIVEFTEDLSQYFPEIINYNDYLGTWETNVYISDSEYGTEWDEIDTLTRVEKKTVIVETTEWVEVL